MRVELLCQIIGKDRAEALHLVHHLSVSPTCETLGLHQDHVRAMVVRPGDQQVDIFGRSGKGITTGPWRWPMRLRNFRMETPLRRRIQPVQGVIHGDEGVVGTVRAMVSPIRPRLSSLSANGPPVAHAMSRPRS
jgi:hypothetical protein